MAIRLGAEDKKKRTLAMISVSLALSAIAYMVWYLAGGTSSVPPPPAATSLTQPTTTQNSAAGQPQSHAAQKLESAAALDPTLHPEWMARAENTTYTGTSRNIFSKDSLPPAAMNAAIEKPIASVRTGPMAASGPPPPPAIDLKFYGFAKQQSGRELIFLSHGDDVFVAAEGDVVNGRYKVVKIESNSVTIEDLSYNDNQTLSLQTI